MPAQQRMASANTSPNTGGGMPGQRAAPHGTPGSAPRSSGSAAPASQPPAAHLGHGWCDLQKHAGHPGGAWDTQQAGPKIKAMGRSSQIAEAPAVRGQVASARGVAVLGSSAAGLSHTCCAAASCSAAPAVLRGRPAGLQSCRDLSTHSAHGPLLLLMFFGGRQKGMYVCLCFQQRRTSPTDLVTHCSRGRTPACPCSGPACPAWSA